MFDRVLVAMDLLAGTDALVSALPGLREFGTRELALVHVAKPLGDHAFNATATVEELGDRLNEIAKGLEAVGFSVTTSVLTGEPVAEIVKAVEAEDPDVLFVGSRSHSRIREAFIGNVA